MMIERETGNQVESHFRTGWEEKGKIIILFCPVPMTRPGKGDGPQSQGQSRASAAD